MDEFHQRLAWLDPIRARPDNRIVDWWAKCYREAEASPLAARCVRDVAATLAGCGKRVAGWG